MNRLPSRLSIWLCTSLLILSHAHRIDAAATGPDLSQYKQNVLPLFEKYCINCHGQKKQKGDIRIDTLNPDLYKGTDGDHWEEVLNQINTGDMPPEEKDQPSKAERILMTAWIQKEMKQAAAFRAGVDGRTSLRRLTRYEFNYTLQDLLDVQVDHAVGMPTDRAGEDGLRNNAKLLGMSPNQFEMVLDLASTAVGKALVAPEKPTVHKHHFEAEKFNSPSKGFSKAKQVGNGIVMYPGNASVVRFKERPREGRFRIRAKVGGKPSLDGEQPKLQIWLGFQATGVVYARELLAEVPVTATIDNPEVMTFEGYMENFPQPFVLDEEDLKRIGTGKEKRNGLMIWMAAAGNSKVPSTDGLTRNLSKLKKTLKTELAQKAKAAKAANRKKGTGKTPPAKQAKDSNQKAKKKPVDIEKLKKQITELEAKIAKTKVEAEAAAKNIATIHMDWFDYEAPYFDQWPPASRVACVGETSAGNASSRAQEALKSFAAKAWRRPVKDSELKPFTDAFNQFHKETGDFDSSIKDALSMLITTPNFLYLVEPEVGKKRPLNAHELASRLSYFLWSSLPDNELRQHADSGRLLDRNVLTKQVSRMLADPKTKRFASHFTEQWLGVDQIGRVAVNPEYFPNFKPDVKEAFQKEPAETFWHILSKDRSAMEFLNADYVVVDETLAKHYGLTGITGSDFREVAVKPEDHRGGVLGMGGFMLAHSDGALPHPIFRGKWILKNLLNDPPPPPPPDVPELDQADPEFAKLPLKKQLEFHRQKEACASCHDKLDPWGLALENYDAIGLWHPNSTPEKADSGRKTKRGKRTAKTKKNRNAKKLIVMPSVDAAVNMPDGTPVNGEADLKKYLVEHKADVFAEGLTRKLLSYSLGRRLTWTDKQAVNTLRQQFESSDYKLDALITAIVQSKAFQTR